MSKPFGNTGNRGVRCLVVCLLVCGAFTPVPLFAETRGFVVEHFHVATQGDKRNCPEGDNGDYGHIKAAAFKQHGFSQEKIARILAGEIPPFGTQMRTLTTMRGRRDGKPANIYHYPASAPDPKFKQVAGPYAYGFDLDGSGPDTPGSFADPETHEKGVDNQLFRVVGCNKGYNEELPSRPYWESTTWSNLAENMAAWVFTLSGENLSADGEVTLRFYQAIGPRRKNVEGDVLFHATYIVNPDPRYHGELRGELKGGVFTSHKTGGDVFLAGDPDHLYAPKLSLSKTRLRLKLNADGSAAGYLGGYQPWMDYWFMAGLPSEANTLNSLGLWHGLSQMADARPDPKTGRNTAISVTYRIESVPAFVARADGKLITGAH